MDGLLFVTDFLGLKFVVFLCLELLFFVTPNPFKMEEQMQRGRCKWFDSKKGFGFITAEDGTDLFVHQTEIKAEGFRNLAEGESVEFRVQIGHDGKRKAVGVTGPNGGFVQGEPRRPDGGRGGYRGDNQGPRYGGNQGGNGGYNNGYNNGGYGY